MKVEKHRYQAANSIELPCPFCKVMVVFAKDDEDQPCVIHRPPGCQQWETMSGDEYVAAFRKAQAN